MGGWKRERWINKFSSGLDEEDILDQSLKLRMDLIRPNTTIICHFHAAAQETAGIHNRNVQALNLWVYEQLVHRGGKLWYELRRTFDSRIIEELVYLGNLSQTKKRPTSKYFFLPSNLIIKIALKTRDSCRRFWKHQKGHSRLKRNMFRTD